jgi:peptidoglycan/xylan/chitin deacetylase (PgdA/CDA1 family)
MLSPVAADVSLALGAAAAVGLAAGAFQYAALWPGSQIFGRALVAPARHGELALTFDDGPNPPYTPRLLAILAGTASRGPSFSSSASPNRSRR